MRIAGTPRGLRAAAARRKCSKRPVETRRLGQYGNGGGARARIAFGPAQPVVGRASEHARGRRTQLDFRDDIEAARAQPQRRRGHGGACASLERSKRFEPHRTRHACGAGRRHVVQEAAHEPRPKSLAAVPARLGPDRFRPRYTRRQSQRLPSVHDRLRAKRFRTATQGRSDGDPHPGARTPRAAPPHSRRHPRPRAPRDRRVPIRRSADRCPGDAPARRRRRRPRTAPLA